MKRRNLFILASAATAIALAGCEADSTGPNIGDPIRSVGVLEYNGDREPPDGIEYHFPEGSEVGYIRPPQPLEVPDSVQRGVPFTIVATTVGDGCTKADGAEVSYTGNTAEITAYDVQEGEVCIQIATFLSREVTLQFDSAGEATVRLLGRRVQNDQELPETVVIEKQITVY